MIRIALAAHADLHLVLLQQFGVGLDPFTISTCATIECMLVNLLGRVNNIKLAHHHGLHPLFEAIINSIHAIDERHEPGRIDVAIRRELSQAALDLGDYSTEPIEAFEITDNGIGFNDENYTSFETSDTMYKASQGGKGIGRLLWLKAFRGADITSTYQQNGEWRTRSFRFTIDGITPPNSTITTAKNPTPSTTVRLYGFQDDYRDKSHKAATTIAKRIIEHCLEYFVLGSVPPIIVHEDRDLETHNLQHIFDNEIQPHSKIDDFTIRERPFRATHLLVGTAYESQHRIYYCAHKRAVHTEALAGKLPDLPSTLKTDERSYVYAGYIAGEFLDETVTPERTSFDGLNDGQPTILPGHVPWHEVTDQAVARAKDFLTPYTTPVKQAKEEQVQNYVRSQAPQYRAHRRRRRILRVQRQLRRIR